MKKIRFYLIAVACILFLASCHGSKHRPKHRKCDCPTFTIAKTAATLKTA
ncbi:MAG: hypothetical protein HXX09_01670 [Bacteroidetes bacterium]|jgi:hypothetical protein|nr:hypothetical protein [Bacteroidota bacterium]